MTNTKVSISALGWPGENNRIPCSVSQLGSDINIADKYIQALQQKVLEVFNSFDK